jgi:hypothetical protein
MLKCSLTFLHMEICYGEPYSFSNKATNTRTHYAMHLAHYAKNLHLMLSTSWSLHDKMRSIPAPTHIEYISSLNSTLTALGPRGDHGSHARPVLSVSFRLLPPLP